jgi:hypothetical protein
LILSKVSWHSLFHTPGFFFQRSCYFSFKGVGSNVIQMTQEPSYFLFYLWGSTLIPWLLTTNPSSFLDCAPNEHFTWFYFNRYLLNLSNNFFKFWQWSSLYLDLAIILSIYTLIFFYSSYCGTELPLPFYKWPQCLSIQMASPYNKRFLMK